LERDYVYVWVDGIHTGVRLGSEARLCYLLMVGVRLNGTKELVALADGYREATESWACHLRDLKGRRGMRAPVLAVGDGAFGFSGQPSETSSHRDPPPTRLGPQELKRPGFTAKEHPQKG
jgi:transposase-like protein